MEVLKLWCDEEQLEKVKVLPSYRRVKPSIARTSRGRLVPVYVVFGDDGLKVAIDKALG